MSSQGPLDDFDQESDAQYLPCPYCGTRVGCPNHEIIEWTTGNCDWIGPLAHATSRVDEDLRRAAVDALRARGRKAFLSHDWRDSLASVASAIEKVPEYDDPEEFASYIQLREYWVDLCRSTPDVDVYTQDFEGYHPGHGDTFGVAYARQAAEAIQTIEQRALQDLDAIRVWAGLKREGL